jgi:uncharacterized protein
MAEFRLDVRPFLENVGGGAHVSDVLEFEHLVVGSETFLLREPAGFDVTVSNAGEGIVAIGSITAPVKATCSRCLCEFDTDIVAEVEGFWLRPGDEEPEDTEISGVVDSEGAIDLAPALIAALVVEAPFAPLHDEDCAGLCPGCGADLNSEACNCTEATDATHPFAALEGLLGTEENGDSG